MQNVIIKLIAFPALLMAGLNVFGQHTKRTYPHPATLSDSEQTVEVWLCHDNDPSWLLRRDYFSNHGVKKGASEE
jgi:hypothetical protein